MNVLIVGRTQLTRDGEACVGALSLDDGSSLRLFESQGVHPAPDSFQIGEVWEMQLAAASSIEPPHCEDVIIQSRRLLGPIPDIDATIREVAPVSYGPVEGIFGGLLRAASSGKPFLSEDGDIPDHSTEFWVADREIVAVDDIYYLYGESFYSAKFKGLDPIRPRILPGELVRFSLARWFVGEYFSDARCYLQVSGSFARKDQSPT